MSFLKSVKKFIILLNSEISIYALRNLFNLIKGIHKGYKLLLLFVFLFWLSIQVFDFIEIQIEKNLNLEKWRTTSIQKIRDNSNLYFSNQGVYLDLFNGIILKGVRIQDENLNYRITSEDVIIHVSILSLLKGEIKFNLIYFKDSKLQVENFNFKTLEKIEKDISELLNILIQEGPPLLSNSNNISKNNFFQNLKIIQNKDPASIVIEDLLVTPLKNKSSSFDISFQLNCKVYMKVQASEKYPTKCNFNNQHSEDEQYWKLDLVKKNERYISLKLENVPYKILLGLVSFYDIAKREEQSPFPKELNISSAYTNGTASLEKVTPNENDKSFIETTSLSLNQLIFQFNIDYKKLNFNFDSPIWPSLNNKNSKGKLIFKIHRDQYESKLKKLDTLVISNLDFELQQENLNLKYIKTSTVHLSPKDKGLPKVEKTEYSIKADLESFPESLSNKDKKKSSLEFLQAKGKMKVSLNLLDDGKEVNIEGGIHSNDIEWPIKFQKKLRTPSINSKIHCTNIALEKKGYKKNLEISIQGISLGTNFDFRGGGDFKLLFNKHRPHLVSKLNLNLEIKNLELEAFSNLLMQIKQELEKNSLEPSTRKYFELGSNEFNSNTFYNIFLSGLNSKTNISLKSMKVAYPLPTDMDFELKTDGYKLHLNLLPLKFSNALQKENFKADFEYTMNYATILPHHQLSLNMAFNQNKNSFMVFTNSEKPPEKISISYKYSGFGTEINDLLRNSYSYLNLSSNQLLIKDWAIAMAIARDPKIQANQANENNLFKSLNLKRTTNGIDVKLNLTGETQDSKVEGQGEYSIGIGGDINYKTITSDSKNALKVLHTKLRILSNGKWVLDFS